MPLFLTPSKSVKAHYAKDNNYHVMQLSGRAPSVLGSPQGDHVTAYRLIEEGLYQAISNLGQDEVSELHWLENRKSIRDKREKLYDFISAIGALTGKKATENFLSAIDNLLEEYNKKRHKKTQLREDTKSAQNDHNLTAERLAAVLREVESRYRFNGELTRDFFTEASRLLLTFYNKVPYSAYFPVEHFEATGGEGQRVLTALNTIKRELVKCDKILDDSAALTVKLSSNLIPAFLDLIHYPEIIDAQKYNKKKKITEIIGADDILLKHQMQTQSDGLKTSKFRDNSKERLVNVLAKHIHILVAVYPELEDIFDVNDIIESFAEKFIKRKPFGWPKFKSKTEIEDIIQKVKDKFQELQIIVADRHYTNYKEYDDLASSSDEEEETTPTPRKPTALSLSEKLELEELRKYKEILDEEVDLPKATIARLKKECPTIMGEKGKGANIFK